MYFTSLFYLHNFISKFLKHRSALILESVTPFLNRILLVIKVSSLQKTTNHDILDQNRLNMEINKTKYFRLRQCNEV